MRKPIDLEALFKPHPPTADQADRYARLNAAALAHAEVIAELTPQTPEQTLAVRKLKEASMLANLAIAVNEPDANAPPPEAPD